MAFSDNDFISKEKHELDYVLRKWKCRTTQANRAILIDALEKFRADDAQAPHTRKEFYEWADRNSLAATLEAAAGDAVAGDASTGDDEEQAAVARAAAGDGGGDGAKRRKWPWWLWLILVVLIIVIVLLILRSCGGCSASDGQLAGGGNDQADAAPVVAMAPAVVAAPAGTTSTSADAAAAPAPAQTTSLEAAPAPAPVALDLTSIPTGDLVVRFLPDSNALAPGETARLSALVAAIRALGADVGTLSVVGHSASVGYPEGELAVSQARAEVVAGRLREAGLSPGIAIVASGRGATDQLAGPASDSRRVVVSNR